MSKYTCIITFALCSLLCYSQGAKPFKIRFQDFVNGDMTIISNNILNRTDFYTNSNVAYNDRDGKNKLNDEFSMAYVDIDDDPETFSSSSAYFKPPVAENLKIVYAGLYWSGTYLYNTGMSKKTNSYEALDVSRGDFKNVKLKLPKSDVYQDIKGQLIYDGFESKEFKDMAPYAVYADITALLQKNLTVVGSYTVANVRATNGNLKGGSSAGWTIIFVYEHDLATANMITSNDGFVGISKQAVEVKFNNFLKLPDGNIEAKIAGAALEGDLRLKGDLLQFKTDEMKDFIELKDSIRAGNNFFNSAITSLEKFEDNRVPNSLNTLGYDAYLMKIPNDKNYYIKPTTKELVLRIKSTGDQFYKFFVAFSINTDKTNTASLLAQNSLEDNQSITKKTKAVEVIKESLVLETPNEFSAKETSKTKETYNLKEVSFASADNSAQNASNTSVNKQRLPSKRNENKNERELMVYEIIGSLSDSNPYRQSSNEPLGSQESKKDKKTQNEPMTQPAIISSNDSKLVSTHSNENKNFEKNYYIVAGVFKEDKNRDQLIRTLKSRNTEPKYFRSPENNFYYVYIDQFANETEAEQKTDLLKASLNIELWVKNWPTN